MQTPSVDLSRLILLVTGSTLEAELFDRPTAYALREAMLRRIPDGVDAASVVICSDLWYLNQDELRACPTISIGGPGTNALTAYLADKLPSAFVIEGSTIIQLDQSMLGEPGETICACWGIDPERTTAAVAIFRERFFEDFMAAATDGW